MDCRRIRIELGGLLHSRAVARVSTLNVGNGSRAEGRRTQRRDEKTAACRTATEAKVPMVVMNAATSVITTRSPYIIRTSMTLPQVTAPTRNR